MTRLTFIPPQFIKVATAYRLDLSQFIVGGIHIPPGSSNGVARMWKVNLTDFSDGGEIPFENAIPKDDSIAIEILSSGDVLVTRSEAAPGGGGATSQPVVTRIPGVFGPYQAVDQPARWQANAAQRTANLAIEQIKDLDARVDALEGSPQ